MAKSSEKTEVLRQEVARFPRARLTVTKGSDKGTEVILEGQTVVVGSDESCQLKLTDSSVSRKHFELSGGPGGYRLRDLKSTNGVYVEGVQVMEARLSDKVRLSLGRTELRFEPERHHIQWPLSPHERFGEVLGRSTSMRRIFHILERASGTDSSIVIEGEPGTGKELLARAVHARSPRKDAPFVVVDLNGSSAQLIDADLFGHDVGAFSGSRKMARPGGFEEADGGTLFIDEVSELSAPAQAKLLRTLETKEIHRKGNSSAKFDARVVASTQKDLEAEVKADRFREDLYMKLSVIRVRVPPLRERNEDIPLLVRQLEAKHKAGEPLSDQTVEMLTRHDWTGNVRELRNVIERLQAFPDMGQTALVKALGKPLSESSGKDAGGAELSKQLLSMPYHEAKDRVLESFEKSYLLEHLRASNGVVTRAAQRASLPRQSVHRMLRRLGIHAADEG